MFALWFGCLLVAKTSLLCSATGDATTATPRRRGRGDGGRSAVQGATNKPKGDRRPHARRATTWKAPVAPAFRCGVVTSCGASRVPCATPQRRCARSPTIGDERVVRADPGADVLVQSGTPNEGSPLIVHEQFRSGSQDVHWVPHEGAGRPEAWFDGLRRIDARGHGTGHGTHWCTQQVVPVLVLVEATLGARSFGADLASGRRRGLPAHFRPPAGDSRRGLPMCHAAHTSQQ